VCVQLHGGMHAPAQQTVGRVNKARHLHVTVSQGFRGPTLNQSVFALRIHVQSYAPAKSSADSGLYIHVIKSGHKQPNAYKHHQQTVGPPCQRLALQLQRTTSVMFSLTQFRVYCCVWRETASSTRMPSRSGFPLVGFLRVNALLRRLRRALCSGRQCHCGRGGHVNMYLTPPLGGQPQNMVVCGMMV
jgi:hypothetical protein